MAIKVHNSAEEWNKAHPENKMTQTTDPRTGATTTSYEDGRSTTVHSRALDKQSDDYAYQRSPQGELDWFEDQHRDELASGNWENDALGVKYRRLQKAVAIANGTATSIKDKLASGVPSGGGGSAGGNGVSTIGGGSGFSYDSASAYADKYTDQISQLYGELMGTSFDDFLGSGQFNNFANRYTLEGQKAMQDTIGQVAGRTGGYAGSFAAQAGQQAYNDRMTALEQAAYEMYNDEQDRQAERLAIARSLEQEQYDRETYADQVAYERGQDALDRALAEDQIAYEREQDALALQLAQQKAAGNGSSGSTGAGPAQTEAQIEATRRAVFILTRNAIDSIDDTAGMDKIYHMVLSKLKRAGMSDENLEIAKDYLAASGFYGEE